ncbi:DUF3971 domain-containing protein [Microvirga massiliensis]|uniref:YhdP family protein n=1 Tax=Microvirga massiliensis TaxID=1033741 RepID=UPI00164D7D07|nr:DUF3971 domain-containing protein [Microvirga massiliensis]
MALGLLAIAGAALAILYLRLAAGPLSLAELPAGFSEAMAGRVGPGWAVSVSGSAIELSDGHPALRASGLEIRNPDGALVLRVPDALISLDVFSLLRAQLQPRSVEFRDLWLRASLGRNGSLSFLPGGEPDAAAAAPSTPESPSQAGIRQQSGNSASQVSLAADGVLDLLVGHDGFLGSLNAAKLSNARLSVIDADRRERTTFHRVDALFARAPDGSRSFESILFGPHGNWKIAGTAKGAGNDYRAALQVADAPAQDLLLLSGLSGIPATVNANFSGELDLVLADGRLTDMRASIASKGGQVRIHDKDTSPFPLDSLAAKLAWDEARGTLDVENLAIDSGATAIRLAGGMTLLPGQGWRGAFSGRNAVLSGAGLADRVVKIDEFSASLSGGEEIGIEHLSVRGPQLAVDLSGKIGRPGDPRALTLAVDSRGTDVRSALRIWPEAVAPAVRRFLVRSLTAGQLESLKLTVDMSGAEFDIANSGGPLPERALKVDFSISEGALEVAQGLPPVRHTRVIGAVTGQAASIRGADGVVDLPGKRSLQASEGSFTIDDFWRNDAIARIGFRLKGSADALGALLREPLIQKVASIGLDPDVMKGKADLGVEIPLTINDIPAFADLPLAVTGTVADLSIEKLVGKEKLESANLAIAYDHGTLAIDGEGKLAGSPASIAIRQAGDAGGEASVSLILDEAGRARRGISVGQKLTGPVAVRATVPIGRNSNTGIRIEADLAKASVDQLLPGWTKPVGRPGRISFLFLDGPSPEVRELHVDAGPVQLRGSAILASDGNLDKLELQTLKLSSGDDMRAVVERANGFHRVTVRGNVGDSRPFIKALAGPGGGAGGRNGPASKDSADLDLDVALNILTGHNEEAMTGFSVKASMRKDRLRRLDLKARLGSSDVTSQTVTRPGVAPVIHFHSEDAGALLRFLDLYERMSGGDLTLQLAASDGPQIGNATLRDFVLRNEPALRRIIPTQSQVVAGRDTAGNVQPMRIDLNEVGFTKARLDFSRSPGRIDFRDAAIWGEQVGFTLAGFVDYGRDRVDVAGTFIPAYGLNNMFAQVPLFGPLLGGGQYEGLFAVNFRVSGKPSAPVLNVNPLSAVAPGFLRRLFGAGAAPEAGAVPPPVSER